MAQATVRLGLACMNMGQVAGTAAALSIAATQALPVMPVLFNRWHDGALDYGGIYIDHFLPKASWVQNKDQPAAFTEAIVGAHATDARILAWDLCNEPFAYNCAPSEIPDIAKAEHAWLEKLYDIAKQSGVLAPITVGICGVGLEEIEPISDVLTMHPYWIPTADKGGYERGLDQRVQFAAKVGKPLLASETCWGSTDDAQRVEIIRYTSGELKKRGIGWLAYLLHHSLIADAHRIEFGPLSHPGKLAFIEADGRLRRGHDVFNQF